MFEQLVSIIIPNYNSLHFIEETLESVFSQTYKNIELIIVDDGSTDGSYEYIVNLKKPDLTIVKNISKGPCAARNFGLSLAHGEYIQFLDADDLLDAEKIENQILLLKSFENRVAVCSTRHFTIVKEEGIITDQNFLFSTDQPQNFLLGLYGGDGVHQNMIAQHAWLVPKSVIDRAGVWDESLLKDQDGEFFCRVVMASEGICYDKSSLCYYRRHKQLGNISSGKSEEHLLSQLKSLNSKSKQLFSESHTQAYKNAMALQYKIIAIDAYPEFRTIYKAAIHTVSQYGGSCYEPVLGGRVVETIKFVFGWKVARVFSVFVHKHIRF